MKSTSLISYLKFNGINMNGKLFTDALRNKSNANLTCYYFLQIVCKLLLLDLIFRNFLSISKKLRRENFPRRPHAIKSYAN